MSKFQNVQTNEFVSFFIVYHNHFLKNLFKTIVIVMYGLDLNHWLLETELLTAFKN